MSIHKPIAIKPLSDYRLLVTFADGVKGMADLSDVAGKGVFSIWNNYKLFEKTYITESGAIAWNEDVDICADTIYLDLTTKHDA